MTSAIDDVESISAYFSRVRQSTRSIMLSYNLLKPNSIKPIENHRLLLKCIDHPKYSAIRKAFTAFTAIQVFYDL